MRRRLLLILAALGMTVLVAAPTAAWAGETGGEGTGTEEPAADDHGELSPETEECIHLAEEADDPDACQEAPSPILPATNELIWGAISFTILFLLLRKLAWPALKQGMEARTERIRTELEAAESAKSEAEQVLDEYRAQLADARAESGRIIEEARQQADAVRRENEQRLQTELAAMRERAMADVESAKAQAMADLRNEVGQLAVGAAEVVVRKNLDRETQLQLVEDFINQVGNRN